MQLDGIHHITCITADAPANVDFYARVLGLRLIKKTVNFDSPDVYHLYYGDERGAPGSILTFFEFPDAARGRAGAGMIHRLRWRVASPAALAFWSQRLAGEGVELEPDAGERALRFRDPEGLGLELRVVETDDEPLRADAADIPAEHALLGFDGVDVYGVDREHEDHLLTTAMGFTRTGRGEYVVEGGRRQAGYSYDEPPATTGLPGAGTVHHIAWCDRDNEHALWREDLVQVGLTHCRQDVLDQHGPRPLGKRRACHVRNLDGSDVGVIIPEGKVHTPKQLVVDHDNEKLYFCDREGMRVHRCDFDGGRHEVLVQTGDWAKGDQKDQTLWCVGITVDAKAGKFYWSQKGPSKGGKGRIFRAGMVMPDGQNAKTRSDIELLFDGLPEPIDLEIVSDSQMLYWTDRGEYPIGNTLNRAFVGPEGPGREKELGIGETQTGVVRLEHHERKTNLLARHFHEAIGLKIDDVAGHIYITDLGGSVYRFDMEGKDKKVILETDGAYTGIGLVY